MPPENTIPDVSPAVASSSGEPTQSVPESPAPTIEAPVEISLPETVQTVPEPAATPEETVMAPDSTHSTDSGQAGSPQAEAAPSEPAAEAVPAEPETGPQGPLPFSKTDDRQENKVAQIPPNEPLAPETPPAEPEGAVAEAEAPQAQPPAAPISPEVIAPVIVPPTRNLIRDILAKASAKIQNKKKAKLDKIMLALTTKNKITNDEVEKLLHVSDATAARYLSVLVKEGKIRKVGTTGRGVAYQKI